MPYASFDRREFCLLAGAGLASVVTGACDRIRSEIPNGGRLTARPRSGVNTTGAGRVPLAFDGGRSAILQLPKNASESPLPLLVMMHGATQKAEDMFWYLGSTPDETGVAVLAPNARDTTWDAIRGSFSNDVVFLDRALDRVFATTAIDRARIAIGGFSDGASYAISLGLINGDLFSSVVAFSPGFIIRNEPNGKPRFFISHGTHDRILPIDACGRPIAARLKADGYEVNFREFEGDHEIPTDVAREGLQFISA